MWILFMYLFMANPLYEVKKNVLISKSSEYLELYKGSVCSYLHFYIWVFIKTYNHRVSEAGSHHWSWSTPTWFKVEQVA